MVNPKLAAIMRMRFPQMSRRLPPELVEQIRTGKRVAIPSKRFAIPLPIKAPKRIRFPVHPKQAEIDQITRGTMIGDISKKIRSRTKPVIIPPYIGQKKEIKMYYHPMGGVKPIDLQQDKITSQWKHREGDKLAAIVRLRYPKTIEKLPGLMERRLVIPSQGIFNRGEFQIEHPNVQIPKSNYGEYDQVKIRYETDREGTRTERQYEFHYSPVSKRKIRIAGSVDNYDAYLNITRNHPELVALRAAHGGEGVGPWGIIPDFGIGMAFESNVPGITGASEREETIIKYLYKTRGDYGKKPSLGGEASYILSDVPFQFAALTGVGMGVGYVVKAGTKAGVRALPKIIPKLPGPVKKVVPKFVSATGKYLGGPSEKTILQTPVGRSFTRWAAEGAVPVTKTTGKVIFSKESFKKYAASMSDDFVDDPVGNIFLKSSGQQVGYVDDFSRVIMFKPKRVWGFSERSFVSKDIAKKYADLLKRGLKDPAKIDVMLRGQTGQNPWADLQIIAERYGYKKVPGGVKYPYRSQSIEFKFAEFPRYLPDEAFLTESQAAVQRLLSGKIPGRTYGSMYNIQSDIARELGMSPELASQLLPEEFLYSKILPGKLTVAAKKELTVAMKNIWAGKQRWNPFTQQLDDVATQTLLPQLGRSVSAEEKALVRLMREGRSVFGKGKAYGQFPSEFMIPVKPMGYDAYLAFLGVSQIPSETQAKPVPPGTISKIQQVQQAELESIYGKGQVPMQDFSPFMISETESRSELDDLMMFLSGRGRQQRHAVVSLLTPVQQQRRAKAVMSKTAWPYPLPPELVQDRIPRRTPRTPKAPTIPWFPIPPPFLPFWLPGGGGKIAGKGRADPYMVQYINEWEMMQQMMKDVIF